MKDILIKWKDGSTTGITIHDDTNIVAAYKPVLSHIKWIAELDYKSRKAIPLYEDK